MKKPIFGMQIASLDGMRFSCLWISCAFALFSGAVLADEPAASARKFYPLPPRVQTTGFVPLPVHKQGFLLPQKRPVIVQQQPRVTASHPLSREEAAKQILALFGETAQ